MQDVKSRQVSMCGTNSKGINVKTEVMARIADTQSLFSNSECFPVDDIAELAEKVLKVFKLGSKIAFVGNGGSAAEAMHLAAEFTGKCVITHAPMPALCLNESQSALTAIANDFGVDQIFSRQVEAHLGRGDIFIALSTSGKSQNILNALTKAVEIGVDCYLWTGKFNVSLPGVVTWNVPSASTPRIQEVHLTWGHILAEVVEEKLEK
jgi:D-sedoheptulose 7-phosphate isomerase